MNVSSASKRCSKQRKTRAVLNSGSSSPSKWGDLVVSWKDKYSEYVIEEAIASAKEFLLHPASIAEKIKAGMDKFKEKEKSPDVDALDPSGLRHDVAGQDSAGQQNDAESKDQNEAENG